MPGALHSLRPVEFVLLVGRSAWDTLTYLFAYWGVPAWGLGGATAMTVLDPATRWPGWFRIGGRGRPLLGALLLGAATHPWHPHWRQRLSASAGGGPFRLAVFLGASHGLTAWFFFLIGPLLGKDVLLSHLAGIGTFAIVGGSILHATGWSRRLGADASDAVSRAVPGDVERPGRGEVAPGPLRPLRALRSESRGALAAAAYGLVLGSVVAAWGLGSPDLVPAEIAGAHWASQTINAVAAVLLAGLLGVPPVGNLFLGTYLWKVGLAHAGLIAFFAAAPLSPVRLRSYRDLFGRRDGLRLGAVIAASALAAGVVTALFWGLLPLEIRYKLIPDQMWTF